jgi:hypothetical protein
MITSETRGLVVTSGRSKQIVIDVTYPTNEGTNGYVCTFRNLLQERKTTPFR